MTTDQLIKLIKEYRGSKNDLTALDGFLYNGGVILTLGCTGIATILGAKGIPPQLVWIPPLLTGIATIWVGIDRALQFGQRWMHHRAVNAAYDSLTLRLSTIEALPEDDRPRELAAIRNLLVELPGIQKAIPGVNGIPD